MIGNHESRVLNIPVTMSTDKINVPFNNIPKDPIVSVQVVLVQLLKQIKDSLHIVA
jgi:abortive infection bacteriophage resistance protein